MSIFVSVIIPVFNDPENIRKVLEALILQTYPRNFYEIIIADNRSTDSTPKVIYEYVEEYPDLVRMFVEEEIQSSYAARNKSVTLARGEILAFTDSDCIPLPDWIEAGVKALAVQSASCGGGGINFFYKSDKPNVYEFFDSSRKLNQKFFVENVGFAATANFFAERRIFKQYGLFRSDLISGGDYEFGRRLTNEGEKIIYIANAIVMHPARSTFREIYEKSKRVATGQKQLEILKLLEHGTLSWRNCLPVIGYLKAKEVIGFQRIHLLFLANFVHYVNFVRRI